MHYLKCVLPAAIALAFVPLSLVSQATRYKLTPDDLATFSHVGAPQVSPDGRWIAYTVGHVDVDEDKSYSDLWMVSWDGKEHVQLTYGKNSASSPRWSPDGKFLAFISLRESDAAKDSQVWVLDRRGGEARQVTNVKEDLGGFRWSPDGKQLLLTLRTKDEPAPEKGGKPKPPQPIVIQRLHFKQDEEGYLSDKYPHLFLFEISSKKLVKLTSAPLTGPQAYAEEMPEWSPDGKRVAFVSNQTTPDPDRVAHCDVFIVNAVPGAKPTKLTDFSGMNEAPLAWTRDGSQLVYRQGISPQYSIYDMSQLMVISTSGGAAVALAPQLDQAVGAPALTTNGLSAIAEVQQDRVAYLAQFVLDGKSEPKRLTPEQGTISAHDEAGGHLAVLWTTDSTPPEIYALEGTRLRKLTNHTDAWVGTVTLVGTDDISAKTPDGNEVHGLLSMPVGYAAGSKVPMVLFIHGGPAAQDTHSFSLDRQLFAAHGYAVLNVNYRGSTGRGHSYSDAINADWGHKEVLDLQAAVDAAIATGKIDGDRMGIGGWSYGGILTDYMIASTTRFKAASSGAGMGNLLGFYGIDQYILQYENELGPPWKNLDAYLKLSYPFLHADRIKTPTLFMGGEKDSNVPVQGGEQMYQALRSVGTPAELIVYPGQFHGFTRPSFIKDRYVRWFSWYDNYVRGIAPKPVTDVPPAVKATAE